MPRYFFDIEGQDQYLEDDSGYEFADLKSAVLYAERVIRELKNDGGWDDPRLAIIVKDENGVILSSIPFLPSEARGLNSG
jgi:hypothetical protein